MFDKNRIFTSADGWITAVPAWRATVEERARALDSLRCSRIVRDLQQNARHGLVALHEAATGMALRSPRDVSDGTLVAAIASAITKGRLILIAGTGGNLLETEEDRLVSRVMGERTVMAFEGRRYRFVPSERWAARSGQGDYRPMLEEEARELVTRMAKQLAKTSDERASWQRLVAALSDGRRGTGIILMRYAPSGGAGARPVDVPVATPSQARAKVAELDWIEIQIVYEDGSPFEGNCVVSLPGGRRTEGPPGADGLVRIEGVDPGSCELSFPDLDAPVWAQG